MQAIFAGKPGESQLQKEFRIDSGNATVRFSVSWIKPAAATPMGSEAVVIGQMPTEPTTGQSAEAATTVPTETAVQTTAHPLQGIIPFRGQERRTADGETVTAKHR